MSNKTKYSEKSNNTREEDVDYEKKRSNQSNRKSGQKRSGNRRSNGNSASSKRSGAYNSPTNDFSFYGLNPQLVIDAASHAFSDVSGTPIAWTPKNNKDNILAPQMSSIPGVMAFRLAPTVGISNDNSSAVNIAARNVYSFVRHANSGHSNYDAPDLMLYLLAMDNIYSFFAYITRIYGAMMIYATKNRYYPKAIVTAMGVNFDDINSNLADFRLFINQFAVKLGSLCVPSNMSYFQRHMQMYSGMYVDDVSQKASTYLMVPAGFLQFNEVSGSGRLDFVPLSHAGVENKLSTSIPHLSFTDLKNYGDALLNAVMLSEDMNIMSGDILKAYGDGGIFKVSTIGEDYMILPTLDTNMLMQIQNLSMLSVDIADYKTGLVSALSVVQNPTTGAILYNPIWNYPNKTILSTRKGVKLMTLPTDQVTPEIIMEASRLTNLVTDADKLGTFKLETCGSEICLDAFMFYYGTETGSNDWTLLYKHLDEEIFFDINVNMQPDGGYANVVDQLEKIARLDSFAWHPAFKVVTRYIDGPGNSIHNKNPMYIQDVNNYSSFTISDFAKMNDVALLSEFNCPQVASATYNLKGK